MKNCIVGMLLTCTINMPAKYYPIFLMFQVVWSSMQREFLNQYKLFVDMIEKCYGASNIALEFTIEDVLGMFSEIARTHN